MVVEPATGNDSVAIKMRYVVGSKEGSQDVADETTNTVDSENVKSVVASQEVLQLCSVVASNTTNDTEDDSGPGRDISGSRGNSDQSGNDTRAETHGGPLALKTVVDQAPGNATSARCNVGADSSHDSAEVSGQS